MIFNGQKSRNLTDPIFPFSIFRVQIENMKIQDSQITFEEFGMNESVNLVLKKSKDRKLGDNFVGTWWERSHLR